MVNASRPPAAICFLGLRSDPQGGGTTLLTSTADVLDQLAPTEHELLRTRTISEGQFFDYRGIGEPLDQFPMLDDGLLRFTAKAEPANIHPELFALYRRLTEVATKSAMPIRLERGHVLVFSNLHYLHGREPLGPGQATLPPTARRCVNQLYLIQCDRCRNTSGHL